MSEKKGDEFMKQRTLIFQKIAKNSLKVFFIDWKPISLQTKKLEHLIKTY